MSDSTDTGPARVRPHLARMVSRARAVLLDFHTTVCPLYSSDEAEALLLDLSGQLGAAGVPTKLWIFYDNPVELLSDVVDRHPEAVGVVEPLVVAAEVAAARRAPLTPGVRAVLDACRVTGRPVGIVGLTAQQAVEEFLARQGIQVSTVRARPPVAEMTGSLIVAAAQEVGVPVEECLAVGNKYWIQRSAEQHGALRVGYAHRPGLAKSMSYPETPVVRHLGQLAVALRWCPPGSVPPAAAPG